jgi:type I restriction enzyme, R subunit
MSPKISERSFEDAIECGLLQYGPDDCAGDASGVQETPPPYGETLPGGYCRRDGKNDYDRALCLLPRDVVDFVLATQPKEWRRLEQHHGAAVRERFLKRLAAEIEWRGALDVLRTGIKDSGCKFRLAWFHPASGLNEETRRLYAANLFAVVRQVRYSTKNEKSLVFVKWKGVEAVPEGDFFVRSGPGTVKLPPDSAREYIRTRFPGFTR